MNQIIVDRADYLVRVGNLLYRAGLSNGFPSEPIKNHEHAAHPITTS
jgi:hypothetical protein